MSKFIPNSFQVPNALVDEALEKISGNAAKAYLLIVRKTRGWQKETDAISLSQFEKIGMSRKTILAAIDELVSVGLVSKTSGSKGVNVFSLNDSDWCKNSTGGEIPLVEKLHHTGGEIPPVTGGESPHTKDTIKNTPKKTPTAPAEQGTPKPSDEPKKPEPAKQPKRSKTGSVFDAQALIDLGADPKHAEDWLVVRAKKKTANTQTALENFISTAKRLGLSLPEAVEYCACVGWAGLRGDYGLDQSLVAEIKRRHRPTVPVIPPVTQAAPDPNVQTVKLRAMAAQWLLDQQNSGVIPS